MLGTSQDFKQSIEILNQVLAEVHLTETTRCELNNIIGANYFYSCIFTQSPDHLKIAEQYVIKATQCANATGRYLLMANFNLQALYQHQSNWSGAYEAGMRAINLLLEQMSYALETTDKQHAMSKYWDSVPRVAYSVLRHGKPLYEAVLALEQGRGVALSSLRDIRRTDLSAVELQYPDLASQFMRESEILDAAVAQ